MVLSLWTFLFLSASFAGEVMNGMRLSDFGNFPEKWRVVTVRYREDSGEMRVTYANPSAWKTLASGSTRYPEGAVFAKIGVTTGVDPDFPSSRVPQESKRFQFMVRNKRYKETGGWGYALFDRQGQTFADDEKETILACYSCHQIVAHRGDVFSQPGGFDLKSSPRVTRSGDFLGKSFRPVPSTELPASIRSELELKDQEIYLYEGKANHHVFSGTLEEMKPSLLEKAKVTGRAVFFLSRHSPHYLGVVPGTSSCDEKKKSFVVVQKTLVPLTPGGKPGKLTLIRSQLCH